MNKYLSVILLACLVNSMFAQNWTAKVERQSGNHKVKTLRIKPGAQLTIGKVLLKNDSATQSRYFIGTFIAGNQDSLGLKIETLRAESSVKNGPYLTRTIPFQLSEFSAFPDSNQVRFALQDVDYLSYLNRKEGKFDPTVPLLLGSFALMAVSPLIAYDYKQKSINAGRLQYWAIGSTVGVVCGFSSIFINAGRNHKKFQFRPDWPNRFSKQWKFK